METKRVETWSAFVGAVDAFCDAYGMLKRNVDGEVVNLRHNTVLFRGQAALCRFVWKATALPDGRRGAKRVIGKVLQA
jgi:hypothetical protein